MQISKDQGALLFFLAKLVGAKKIVEVGCFTGYSGICLASALEGNGKLVTLDIDPQATKVATEYFQKAGLSEKIELILGDAKESLVELEKKWGSNSTDMFFIDADKENYETYYEQALSMLRPGGLMVIDNVLWSGSVIKEENQHPATVAIRKINDKIISDERVERVMLSTADGLYLCRKKTN
jgi:predicted O-methyltransferase YrrM